MNEYLVHDSLHIFTVATINQSFTTTDIPPHINDIYGEEKYSSVGTAKLLKIRRPNGTTIQNLISFRSF